MAKALFYLIIALIAWPLSAVWAQPAPLVPPEFVPYSALAQVPANGCVWGNLIFSNGAVIERQLTTRVYFRCVKGDWQSFPTLEQATSKAQAAGNPAPAR